MKPRADWVCNSKKCRSETGEAPVYELPVDATRCPYGHKAIVRLFNRVGVIGARAISPERDWRLTSSSPLVRSTALLQDSFDANDRLRASARDLPSFAAGHREQRVNLPQGREFIIPAQSQTAAMLGLSGKGREMTQLEIHREIRRDRLGVPALLQGLNRTPMATRVVGESKS